MTEYLWKVDWSVSTTQGTLEPKTQRMCMALRHRDMAQHAPACLPESGRAPVRQLGKAGQCTAALPAAVPGPKTAQSQCHSQCSASTYLPVHAITLLSDLRKAVWVQWKTVGNAGSRSAVQFAVHRARTVYDFMNRKLVRLARGEAERDLRGHDLSQQAMQTACLHTREHREWVATTRGGKESALLHTHSRHRLSRA